MGKQFTPKFAACTSLFFFLAFSGAILAQNPTKGAAAARDATRNKGRATTQRQAPPTTLASLDRRSALTLQPIVIYYSRDGAEVDTKKSPNIEKRTSGIGESITIYYGSKKPSVPEPTKSVPKPKNEQLATTITKPSQPKMSPAKSYAANEATSFAPATPTTEKPIDAAAADPKAAVAEPAVVPEAAKTVGDEKPKVVDNPASESKADPVTTKGTEPVVPTDSEAKAIASPISGSSTGVKPEAVAPAPASNTSADIKRPTETAATDTKSVGDTKPEKENAAPTIPTTVAETKPATETAVSPASNPSADAKLSSEAVALNAPAETKPPTESTPGADTVAMNNTAVQLTRERRYEEASVLLHRAIQAEPDTFKFHRNLSIVYEEMNKMNEALESAKAAVKLAPREPSALVQLCGVQLRLKEHNEALGCYENLRKLTTLDPLTQTYYGVALLGSGRVLDALGELEKAAAATPANSITLNALGFVYFNERRFGEAVSTFKKAVELAPDQHEIRLNLGIAHLANGNREGALSQYKVLKHENPKLAEQLYKVLFSDKVVSVDQLKHR